MINQSSFIHIENPAFCGRNHLKGKPNLALSGVERAKVNMDKISKIRLAHVFARAGSLAIAIYDFTRGNLPPYMGVSLIFLFLNCMLCSQCDILSSVSKMIIIDGHNLLHAICKVEEDTEVISGVELCLIIGRYFKLTNRKGEIIFDGSGPSDKSGFDGIGNLEVLFAGAGTDADTVIEDKISANTAPKRLTIVSSDRRLRRAARARKATPVKSEVFWNDVQKQLSRKRPVKEPRAKRQGLTNGETNQWLEIFGLEQ